MHYKNYSTAKDSSATSSSYIKNPLVSNSAVTGDYTSTGYDRGHLTPKDDFKFTTQTAKMSNYMTNIAP